jgi:peptidyl-tRNA hydrolase
VSLAPTLRLYAIVRNDLKMTPGKSASQAGHCVLGSFIEASKQTPEIAAAYAADLPGTKVVLQASTQQIYRARLELQQTNIPHFVTIDSGCPDFFNGEPILTGIGFGPCTSRQLPKYIRKLQLL